MIIAIDGPSGTGKSTVAKEVARQLKITFFDTGAMYRSFAWHIKQHNANPQNEEEVVQHIDTFFFEVRTSNTGEKLYFVNGEEIGKKIRSQEIAAIASQIAVFPKVREAIVQMQRELGQSLDAVFEGRDMGTVVFPDAEVKIFLTASLEIRTTRRYEELSQKFPDIALNRQTIAQEIAERDHNDANRETSPLKQAKDAILIDTSFLSVADVVRRIVLIAKQAKRPQKSHFLYFFILFFAKCIFRMFFRIKIYGRNHILPGGGLLIANHVSHLDPPFLATSCNEEVHFLAKESLFRVPIFGRFIRKLNAHPVSRRAADAQVLKQMIGVIKRGKKLMLFPEGKRSETGELQPLQRGLMMLAQRAKCPVFPAYIGGTYESWPSKRKSPSLFRTLHCVFGSPILWEDIEKLPVKEREERFLERCRESILELRKWLEEGAKGTPP